MKENFEKKESKHFRAAMYLRLSREDGDMEKAAGNGRTKGRSKPESVSIGSQRELLRSFVRSRRDMEIYDTYVDDGYSGINFVEVR